MGRGNGIKIVYTICLYVSNEERKANNWLAGFVNCKLTLSQVQINSDMIMLAS